MAITNYATLQAAIADYMVRDGDEQFASAIPMLIQNAEQFFHRTISHRRMETSTTLSTTVGVPTVAMPTDLLGVRSLRITDGLSGAMEQSDLGTISAFGPSPGRPVFYTVSGSNFRFGPTPDGQYEIECLYQQKIPALSTENPTNWLLAEHPDLYLWASLIEGQVYIASDTRLPVFAEKLKLAMESLDTSNRRATWQAGSIQVRLDFDTP